MAEDRALALRHEDSEDAGAFYFERDGRRLGQQVYRRVGERRIVIEHTDVDPSLRGQGIGRRLLDATVAWARETGTRVAAECPYARAQLERDATLRDVLDPE